MMTGLSACTAGPALSMSRRIGMWPRFRAISALRTPSGPTAPPSRAGTRLWCALTTSKLVKAKMASVEPRLPAGYQIAYANDSSDFIRLSVVEVVKTLAEAMALVKSEGDVVIAGGTAPERFVSGPGQCTGAEIAELRFVPTRDNPQCPIGYRCREPGFEEWNW